MVSLHKIDTPENLEFKQKTEIVSVSFYPIKDKDFNELKVTKGLKMVITMEVTIWLNGFLLPKSRKIIRQQIEESEFEKFIKHLRNGKPNN